MSNLFANEPAVVIAGAGAILEAVFLVALAFGVPITADQKLALGGLATCVITVLTGWFTRGQVTPVAGLPVIAPVIAPVPPAA